VPEWIAMHKGGMHLEQSAVANCLLSSGELLIPGLVAEALLLGGSLQSAGDNAASLLVLAIMLCLYRASRCILGVAQLRCCTGVACC
jgi:hypothetical protein